MSLSLQYGDKSVGVQSKDGHLMFSLSGKTWLYHRFKDGFVCDSLQLVERQTKRSIDSYSLLAHGKIHGMIGVLKIFVIFSKTPAIYVSEFSNTIAHIGARKQGVDGTSPTKYEQFSKNQYSNYMSDVVVQKTTINSLTDEMTHILAFLTQNELLNNTSHVSMDFLNRSLDELSVRKAPLDSIIVAAQTGKFTLLDGLLEINKSQERDLFTYALRESIAISSFECALLLLKDGRADPTFHFDDIALVERLNLSNSKLHKEDDTLAEDNGALDYFGREDRHTENIEENPRWNFPAGEEALMLESSTLFAQYLKETQTFGLSGTFEGIEELIERTGKGSLRYLISPTSIVWSNAILLLSTKKERSIPLMRHLVDTYEWTPRMLQLMLYHYISVIPLDLFRKVQGKCNIIDWSNFISKFGGNVDVFLEAISQQRGSYIEASYHSIDSAIRTLASVSDRVAEYFIENDYEHIRSEHIAYVRMPLLIAAIKRNNLHIVRDLCEKESSRVHLDKTFLFQTLPRIPEVMEAQEPVISYILDKFIETSTNPEDAKHVLCKSGQYIEYLLKNKLFDVTGTGGAELFMRVCESEHGPTHGPMFAKFGVENGCMHVWFPLLLRNTTSHTSEFGRPPSDAIKYVIECTDYDPSQDMIDLLSNTSRFSVSFDVFVYALENEKVHQAIENGVIPRRILNKAYQMGIVPPRYTNKR